MTSKMESLEIVNERLATLEKRVYGNMDTNSKYTPVAETLSELNVQISAALSGREKVTNIMKRMDELERYLDPQYGEAVLLDSAAKMEIILCAEPELQNNLKYLHQIEVMKPVLDSEHIKSVPMLSDKLERLTLLELEKKEKCDQVSTQVQELLQQYNDLITTLTKMFIQWDNIVTQQEVASQGKKG